MQSPKTHAWEPDTPIIRINDYAGRIYYGQTQFCLSPKEPRIVSSGTQPVRLILAGHLWYDTTPRSNWGRT